MALDTAKDISRYHDRLEHERRFFDPTWQDIGDQLVGKRDFISPEEQSPGRERHIRIYDTTALFSGNMLSSAMHQWLTNTASTWWGLKPEMEELLEDEDVALWFSRIYRIMNASFNRPESGFVPAMNEYWSELVWFGTACIYIEDVPGLPVRFRAIPLQQLYVSEGENGRIDTVVRKFPLTHRQAVAKFAGNDPERAKRILPKSWEMLNHAPEERRTFLHIVHPSDDLALDPKAAKPRRFAYRSAYVDREAESIVQQGGFHEQPYKVGRWDKEPGEVYGGNYPGKTSLPEGKMLNAMGKTFIKAAEKKVDPPLQVADDGVILPLRTQPGGINVVRASTFAREPIKPLPIESDVGLAITFFQERQKAVRAAFLHDLLAILQTPFQTATQVIEITEKAQALASPTVGRQQVETLEPMIERVYNILRRAKMLPPAPPVLLGQPLKVEYISPVQRSQRLSEVRVVEQFLTSVANLAIPLDAASADTLDMDKAVRMIGRGYSVPPEIMRGVREVAKMRDAQRQMVMEDKAQSDAMMAAQAAGKAAPALKLLQGGQPT